MPSSHGVTNPQTLLAPEQETLAELLEIRGYETGAIVSNLIINRERGFAQGFDDFDESLIGRRKSSRKVSDLAIHWLRKKADSKFFLFVHYYDPHYPYIHHPRFDRTSGYQGAVLPEGDIWELRDAGPSFSEQDLSHLVGRYHEEIAFTDDHIGRVLDELRVQGLYDRTIILVVADHGEELMDHGWIGHTRTLYEELLHVPMILRVGNAVQPRRLEMPVSLLDVMPTLRALAGDRGEDRTQGISLVPYLFGGLEPDRQRSLFAEVSFRFSRPPDDTKTTFKTSLLADGYKTIHDLPTDSWEIYDLAADPEEKNNLAGSGHAAEAELRRRLLAWETSRTSVAEGESSRSFEPSPQDIERLRALGYVE
jgi:arylsulfatase A-like enzyme